LENNSWDPTQKNPSQTRAGGVAQGIGPEFKPQYCKKKKEKKMLLAFTLISNGSWKLRIISGFL
jgi:hypothetical protein